MIQKFIKIDQGGLDSIIFCLTHENNTTNGYPEIEYVLKSFPMVTRPYIISEEEIIVSIIQKTKSESIKSDDIDSFLTIAKGFKDYTHTTSLVFSPYSFRIFNLPENARNGIMYTITCIPDDEIWLIKDTGHFKESHFDYGICLRLNGLDRMGLFISPDINRFVKRIKLI